MKKNAIFVLMLFAAINIFAQKGFQVGGNFTPGLSYMLAQNHYYLAPNDRANDPSKELDYKAKFSFNANVFFGYNISEKHGLRLHAGYNQEGQKYEDIFKWLIFGLQGRHTKEVNFEFANTALLYRFSPVLKGQKEKNPNGNYPNGQYKIRMRILVGVETDILVNAGMTYKIERVSKEEMVRENYLGVVDITPAPDFTQYPFITPVNGGYETYYDMGKPASQKTYFVPVQAALLFNYGFDYIFKSNVYFGLGLDFKIGLNDINAKAYRVHPEYHKSKNYFFGLKVELGYNILKNNKKTPKTPTAAPPKTKVSGAETESSESKDSVETQEDTNYKSKEISEKAYTTYTRSGQKKDVNIKKLKPKKKKKR
jgi:hypothetical protein